MGLHFIEKTHLSAKGMLQKVRSIFEQIPENERDTRGLKATISTADCLISGLALFGLKFPSLLQFEQAGNDPVIQHNLKTLYGIENIPSDTYMRERLDEIDPRDLRGAFTAIFSQLQRGKVLDSYKFLNKYIVIANDGTGMFSSSDVHCENCCEKHHKDGSITYYHQMLGSVVIHPDHKEVFPLCPEPISKPDGSTKNDCEQNAMKRLLEDFHKEHPHLEAIFVCDALSSRAPPIRQITAMGAHFIFGVKPDGNGSLFEWLKGVKLEQKTIKTKKETIELKFYNKIPLNDANHDLEVNFIECTIRDKNGKNTGHFTWVTDIVVTHDNVYELSRAGRARWKIENETFNTLKNQGYHFEHNFGHGYKHLSHVFGTLMFLAFLIDQVQQHCCGLFQKALEKMRSKTRFWKRLQALFSEFYIDSWEDMFTWMSGEHRKKMVIDTS